MRTRKYAGGVRLVLLLLVGSVSNASAWYEPSVQRWVNRDPVGERDGVNLYGFVGNNPLSYVDSLGLQSLGTLCRLACEVGARPPLVGRLLPPEGTIENPFRPGSWGRIDPQTGKFQECWRSDKGTPGKPGWGGIDHFHYWGSPEHLVPPLPPFKWFTVPPVNGPPTTIIAPPGVRPPPGFVPISPPTTPKPLPPGTVEA